MKRRYKFLIGVTATFVLLASSVTWLMATASGARWLLARAEPYLPEALAIEGVSGSLLAGLSAESVSWNDEAANVDIERLFIDVRILPLLSRRVYVDRLQVGALHSTDDVHRVDLQRQILLNDRDG